MSKRFVNVRRENVILDKDGIPSRPQPTYNPLRPEKSGMVQKSGADLEEIREAAQGRILNPHVPLFIAKAPWYSDIDHVVGTRKDVPTPTSEWYQRGSTHHTTEKASTKYRKGACENCGAMTHKTRECMDRPRKVGAKFTGLDIKGDERVEKVELGFEAKRDRWNGFEASDQLEQIREWELVEEKRKAIRTQKLAAGIPLGDDDSGDEAAPKKSGEEEEEVEEEEGVEQKVDMKNRMTTRNLRIREDTAKYLRNLDLESAYYDPKTRTMRENPYAGKDPKELLYAGDNFERYGGEVKHVVGLKDFAWDKTMDRDTPVTKNTRSKLTIQSNPTQAEILYKSYAARRADFAKSHISKQVEGVLAKYGGEEYLEKSGMSKELAMAATEEWVEYNASGDVINGKVKGPVLSIFDENVMVGNHTEIWGSYWEDGEWGFKCCQSLVKGSYCGGQNAIDAKIFQKKKFNAMMAVKKNASEADEAIKAGSGGGGPVKSLMDVHKEKFAGKGKAVLALERLQAADAKEKERLEEELKEIREREKREKAMREKLALEDALAEKKRIQAGLKNFKFLSETTKVTPAIRREKREGDLHKFMEGMAADKDDMTPFLPVDAKVAVALRALEESKVSAQGAMGFSYLRKKRKWEMTEKEQESYRIVQHNKDDPMAKYQDK